MNRRLTLLLTATFVALAIVAHVFEWSFVLGRRGFDTAEGVVAHYAGGFWDWLALLTLSTLIPNPTLRKKVGSVLAFIFLGLIFGSMIYLLLIKRA